MVHLSVSAHFITPKITTGKTGKETAASALFLLPLPYCLYINNLWFPPIVIHSRFFWRGQKMVSIHGNSLGKPSCKLTHSLTRAHPPRPPAIMSGQQQHHSGRMFVSLLRLQRAPLLCGMCQRWNILHFWWCCSLFVSKTNRNTIMHDGVGVSLWQFIFTAWSDRFSETIIVYLG